MIENSSSESFIDEKTAEYDLKEIEARLENLFKKDRLFPVVIAARAALRVLPLVGFEGSFNFWEEQSQLAEKDANTQIDFKDKNDNRAAYLLAIFLVSREVVSLVGLPADKREFNKIVASSAYTLARAATEATKAIGTSKITNQFADADAAAGAAGAASTAACVAEAYTTDAAEVDAVAYATDAARAATAAEAAARAAYAAYANYNGVAYADADTMKVLEQDIQHVEGGKTIAQLAAMPLYPNQIPKEIDAVYRRTFIFAVNRLIREIESSSKELADALTSMLTQFDTMLMGKPEQASINTFKASETIAAENDAKGEDKLNRQQLVSGLTNLLTHKDNNEHLTVGLLGHWGAGKTRVLQLLKQAIKGKKDKSSGFLFGEFNAWAYEHSENPQAAMAHEVIKSLTTCPHTVDVSEREHWLLRKCTPVRNLLTVTLWKLVVRSRLSLGFMVAKYPWRLIMLALWPSLALVLANYSLSSGLNKDTLLSLQGLTGMSAIIAALFAIWRIPKELKVLLAQPYTKELLSYLKLPDYAKHIGQISEMRQDIELMVNIRLGTEQGHNQYGLGKLLPRRRLLFVVDDLDRCSPAGIVKTFEAIRLVLDLPQVIVVVAVDQRIALAALALHYEELTEHHQLNDAKAIARDYLAKMLQLPIVVNDGDATTLKGYMSHLWQDKDNEFQEWQALLADKFLDETMAGNHEEAEVDESFEKPKLEPEPEPEKSNSETEQILSEQELVERVLALQKESELIDALEPNVEVGLDARQKAAFAYWTGCFGLTNARQVKRLYNSYNLMRLVSNEEDVALDMGEEKFAYGLLVTLLSIECVNGIEDNKTRCSLNQYLRTQKAPSNDPNISEKLPAYAHFKQATAIIQQAAKARSEFKGLEEPQAYKALLDFVSLFVLPAIDGFEPEPEQ